MFAIPWWRGVWRTKEFLRSVAMFVVVVVAFIRGTAGGNGNGGVGNWSIVPSRSHGCDDNCPGGVFGVGETFS